MTLTGTSKSNNPAFDASADWMNAVTNAINSLISVSWQTAIIPDCQDHVTVTHGLGIANTAADHVGVVFMPTDDVGRCWYDMLTITADTIDIWVANPPLGGDYVINFLIYWK